MQRERNEEEAWNEVGVTKLLLSCVLIKSKSTQNGTGCVIWSGGGDEVDKWKRKYEIGSWEGKEAG